MITKDTLDMRICDIEDCENTQTYREFIRQSEDTFGYTQRDLDNIDDVALNDWLDHFLFTTPYTRDSLWSK